MATGTTCRLFFVFSEKGLDMEPLTLSQILDMADQGAQKIFEERGETYPMFIFEKDDGLVFAPAPWKDEADKVRLLQMVAGALAALGVTQYAMVSEMWLASYQKNNNPTVWPSEREDRMELLAVFAVDKSGARLARGYRILRESDKPTLVFDLQMTDALTHMKGRIFNLLEPDVELATFGDGGNVQ